MIKEPKLPFKISKYQVIEELGRGGMGIVYKAFAPQLATFVALKVLLVDKADKNDIQRFVREARAMAKMSHPNIIKVYDVGVEQGLPYFTMQYIEGASLRTFLQNTTLNIRLFSQLMVKLSKAIAYAHNCGVIHRDLKPANIMIDLSGQPYVADFGLAKLTHANQSLSQKGAIMGTLQYMSPQQAGGQAVDQRTDIYALGAIFYEMLCNQKLVDGNNAAYIIYKVLYEEPELLRTVNKKLSKDLEAICHKAVAKDIQKRYQNANAFAQDIERFLNGELISAKAIGIYEKAWGKLYKHKFTMLLIVAIVLLTLTGIWLFEKRHNVQAHLFLLKARNMQQQIGNTTVLNKQMEIYIQVVNLLEKAIVISPNNLDIKKWQIKTIEKMALLAKKQKNYLLSFALFKQCQRLGYKQANKSLQMLQQEESRLKKKHIQFVFKIMQKKVSQVLTDQYVFTLVKIQKPYLVKILVPYLNSLYKWQRLLAIKALGKLGNTYTKHKSKDSVEWLLRSLKKFKDRKSVLANQDEVEELIWALGWLKDPRANQLIHKTRHLVDQKHLLWINTKIPYRWIPLGKKTLVKNKEFFFFQGTIRAEKEDYLGAIKYFTQALATYKTPAAYNSRGHAYAMLKEYKKAIKDYSKAIALAPNYPKAYNNRAGAYQRLKNFDKAIADYNKAIALEPQDSKNYYNRAIAYQTIYKNNKAIADYSKTILLNPQDAEAYSSRGSVYGTIKNYKKALADFNKSISLNPKYSIAYTNRGSLYVDLKNYIKAISDYTMAITLSPKRFNAYSCRGRAYLHLKEYTKAIADLNTAIILNPKAPEIHIDKGDVYLKKKMYQKAIASYTTAIALAPKYPRAYNCRGSTYGVIREYKRAIVDFTKAVTLDPKYATGFYNRGSSYQHLKEYSKAIADYTTAISLDPKYPDAYNNRGLLYRGLKEYSKAIADFNKIVALDPKFFSVYVNRGVLYFNTKQYQKAHSDFTIFLKLVPRHPMAPRIRAVLESLKKRRFKK